MGKNRLTSIAIAAGLLAVSVALIAFNVINLSEAFGSGPPYYGRTTNMDKWTNPLPVLAAVDVVGVFIVASGFYFLKRKR
jgi:hypothetical protein